MRLTQAPYLVAVFLLDHFFLFEVPQSVYVSLSIFAPRALRRSSMCS